MASPIVDSLHVEPSSAPMILIVGQTGAGKSHFCNRVLGEDVDVVEESAGLSSCALVFQITSSTQRLTNRSGTSKPDLVPAFVDGKEYLLIDTPGFNDTFKHLRRSDATILGEIALALTLQSQLGVPLVSMCTHRDHDCS